MQCTSEWMIWHIKVLNWPNAISSQFNWSGTQTRSNSNSKCYFINCPNHHLSYSVRLTCSNMHDHGINRFFIFFWSFFIYNLFDLELRLILYDFKKFGVFSEISWIIINPETDLWRQHHVMLTSAGQQASSKSNLTSGAHLLVTRLINWVN